MIKYFPSNKFIKEYRLKFPNRFEDVPWHENISWQTGEQMIKHCFEAINDLPNSTLMDKKAKLIKCYKLNEYTTGFVDKWEKELQVTSFSKHLFDDYKDDPLMKDLLWQQWHKQGNDYKTYCYQVDNISLKGRCIHELPKKVQKYIWDKEHEFSEEFYLVKKISMLLDILEDKLKNQIQFLEDEHISDQKDETLKPLNDILKEVGIKKSISEIMISMANHPFIGNDAAFVQKNNGKYEWSTQRGVIKVISGLIKVIWNESIKRQTAQSYTQEYLLNSFKNEFPDINFKDRSRISKLTSDSEIFKYVTAIIKN